MKKIILSSIICLGSYAMLATHLMGGEITVQNIGNGNHLVTLLVYRDTIGIPMDTNVTFHFSNTQGANHSLTTGYDSIISGNLLPMYPYGVEVYLFIDTISFLSPGLWEVYQEDCCRNAAIQNLSHPLGESMVLKSSLMVNATSSNSSPFFLVPAAIFLPINTLWQYNPLPFDPDGDSLSWRLDTPLTKFNQYCAGYTNPGADPTNPSPMTIDPVTGTITWTAKRIGNTVASILVDQHRNGQYMGHIRRDMQFIVVDTNQGFPTWQNLSMLPLDGSNHYAYDIRPGQAFKMELIAGHSDSSKMQNLSMTAYSELLQDPQFGASFITSVQAGNLKGSFSWQPQPAHHRNTPYLLVYRVSDGYITNDKTIKINVLQSGIGLNEYFSEDSWSLYPNPAKNQVEVALQTPQATAVNLSVHSLAGTMILARKNLSTVAGTTVFSLSTQQWAKGTYLIKISDAAGNFSSKLLMVQ